METEDSPLDTDDSRITPLTELALQNNGDAFPAILSNLGFIVGSGAITVLFPALVYYSVLSYGLLASGFLATGYEVWRVLARRNPKKAQGFLIGFTPLIVLTLIFYLSASPLLVGTILVEFAAFVTILRLLDS